MVLELVSGVVSSISTKCYHSAAHSIFMIFIWQSPGMPYSDCRQPEVYTLLQMFWNIFYILCFAWRFFSALYPSGFHWRSSIGSDYRFVLIKTWCSQCLQRSGLSYAITGIRLIKFLLWDMGRFHETCIQCNQLKSKSCHDPYFVFTGGTRGCCFKNMHCYQWPQR